MRYSLCTSRSPKSTSPQLGPQPTQQRPNEREIRLARGRSEPENLATTSGSSIDSYAKRQKKQVHKTGVDSSLDHSRITRLAACSRSPFEGPSHTIKGANWSPILQAMVGHYGYLLYGCGSKNRYQNGTLVSGNMEKCVTPSCLILSRTHMDPVNQWRSLRNIHLLAHL